MTEDFIDFVFTYSVKQKSYKKSITYRKTALLFRNKSDGVEGPELRQA